MPLTNPKRLTGYADAQQYARENSYSDAFDTIENDVAEYDDEEDEEEEEEEVEEDDASSLTSELSIPDSNIDFSLVYALHTFVATVEGQASVVKGDALTLLDDSNSYWWLIKVLKTSEVGYIPAENIETPYERLARLNSHINVELTSQEKSEEMADSAKPARTKPSNKKVTLAKEVMFQAQHILSNSDDEEVEEEYEEWEEEMRSETDSDFDSGDDIYEIDDPENPYTGTYPRQGQSDLAIKNHDQPAVVEQAPMKATVNKVTTHEMEQVEPIVAQKAHTYHSTTSEEPEVRSKVPVETEPRKSSPYKPGLDLDEDETIKISLTPSIARDDEFADRKSDDSDSRLRKASKLDRILSKDDAGRRSEDLKDSGREESKEKKGGFKRFFSRGKESKDKKKKSSNSTGDNRRSSDTETSSINSQSTGYSDHRKNSVDSAAQDYQPTPLRIYAGNIQFSSPYKTVYIYPSTTAAELVERAVDTFDIQDTNELVDGHLDFYISIKGADGDEYTLIPQDKPLSIFNTLTAHLNTPMPSLKKARRISQLMSMGDPTNGGQSHVGGPKSGNNLDGISEIKLYLNRKVKRVDERDGKIHIKVVCIPNSDRQRQENKILAVAPHALTGDIIVHALERFHITNGYAYDFADEDEPQNVRYTDVPYTLSISVQGQVTEISSKDKILSAFRGSISELYPKAHNGNPERASTSSIINTPEAHETYFILKARIDNNGTSRKPESERSMEQPSQQQQQPRQQQSKQHGNHGPRHHQLVRQNTPAMLDTSRTKLDSPSKPEPTTEDQRTKMLEILAITEDISDDSDSDREDKDFTESPTSAEPERQLDLKQNLQEAVTKRSSTPDSQNDDDIMSQLNKVLDDFGRSEYKSPPLTSPLGDGRSISSIETRSTYSQDSIADSEARSNSQHATRNAGQEKLARSASTMRKAHQSMMFSDNFGLEALMTLVRGDAEYLESLERSKHGQSKHDRELTSSKYMEEVRIQVSKELYGDQLSQLDAIEKILDQVMGDAIRLFP
ncbi:hypothetical protein BC943DRAFT_349746 [Umbelopsis sp. AD052]|nr:hypothetical protein BC943DRAFT_349746 [Umbelopsis sp. AD052]